MENKNEVTQLNKPFALMKKELVESIVNSINQSGLSLEIIQYIMRDILNDINAAVAQQEDNEIAAYEAQLAEQKAEE